MGFEGCWLREAAVEYPVEQILGSPCLESNLCCCCWYPEGGLREGAAAAVAAAIPGGLTETPEEVGRPRLSDDGPTWEELTPH